MVSVIAGCYDGSVHGWRRLDLHGECEGKGDVGSLSNDKIDGQEAKFELAFGYKSHISCVKCIALSSGNGKQEGGSRFLASGGMDEIVRVYDWNKLQEIGELVEHCDTVLALEFVGNEYLLSGGKDGKLLLWRCRDWNCVANLKGHKPGPVTSIAVHPSGILALTTSMDDSLRMWDLEIARPASRNKLEGYSFLEQATWSPCGKAYVVVADSRTVLFFLVANTTGKPDSVIKCDQRVNSLCFVAKPQMKLVLGLESKSVVVFDFSIRDGVDMKTKLTFPCDCRVRSVSTYNFSDDSEGVLVAQSDGKIKFLNLKNGDFDSTVLQAGSSAHLTCMISDMGGCAPKMNLEKSIGEKLAKGKHSSTDAEKKLNKRKKTSHEKIRSKKKI